MYTATIWWGEFENEEIDVEAESKSDALVEVMRVLVADYQPGWTHVEIGTFKGIYIMH